MNREAAKLQTLRQARRMVDFYAFVTLLEFEPSEPDALMELAIAFAQLSADQRRAIISLIDRSWEGDPCAVNWDDLDEAMERLQGCDPHLDDLFGEYIEAVSPEA